MKRNSILMVLLVCVMVIGLAGTARAIDPREGIAAPGGTDYFQMYIVRNMASNFYKDGNKTSINADATANTELLRYGHVWKTGEKSVFMASAIVGLQDINVNGTPVNNVNQGASGMTDPTLLLAWWPYANWQEKHFFAIAAYTTFPWGDYDNKRLVNVGANVWNERAELVWVKGWGKFYLQLVGDCYFYGDNTNYGPRGLTLQRDNLYVFEMHPSYSFTPDFWLGVSGYYSNGGQTKVQQTGNYNSDNQNDWTVGVAAGYNINKNLALLLSSKFKAQTNNGFDNNEVLRIKLTYFW
jgi:hypothetical protein